MQRGSVMDMPIHPGDPLSPGWASEPGGRKLAQTRVGDHPQDPGPADFVRRRAADASKALTGPGRAARRGAARCRSRITSARGRRACTVKLAFDWQSRPLHNVIVRIDGSTFPDEWIIFGNHHDAWVNGADDPTSGAVALMETARGLSELLKTGWRPKRTIILALWDGEEWGLLGSTEWAEKHAAGAARQGRRLHQLPTAAGKGWLSAGGSHGLQQLLNEVARDILDPRTGKPIVRRVAPPSQC